MASGFRPHQLAAGRVRLRATRRGGRRAPRPRCPTRAVGALERRARSSGRPLGNGERDLLRLAGAAQAERNSLADAVWPEGAQQRLHMQDRLAVPSGKDVALMDARQRPWSMSVNAA